MKYSLFFAASAAGYAVVPTSSAPVYPVTTPAYQAYPASSAPVYGASSVPVYGASSAPVYGASSKDTCYSTITPGYGQAPVTITKQNQAYPTCVSTAYGTCAKWGQNVYVSTTIKDYNNKPVCVTNVNKKITLYSTKSTITYPAGSKPTGAGYKQDSTGCYYQVVKKIEYAPYGKLGSNALSGYPGSGLCKNCCNSQPIWVKVYQNGNWTTTKTTQSYGVPTAKVTTYATPGVYTVPAKAMTVTKTAYYAAEVTKTASAGETCVYGGKYAMATNTGKITVPYGAYTTKVVNGQTSTYTVVKTTTVYASSTGKVTVCTPTTTVYAQATTYCYPTASWYAPGVYSYGAKTVTITSANHAYTCPYEQRIYPVTSTPGYPVMASATPAYPTGSKPSVVPPYPMYGNSTAYGAAYPSGQQGYPGKPVSTPGYPVYAASTPGYPVYAASTPGYPVQAAVSTPCTLEKKPSPTPYQPSNNQVSYPAQPVYAASSPVYPAVYPTPTPNNPANNYPVYPATPIKATSTPCPEEQKQGYPTQVPSYGN